LSTTVRIGHMNNGDREALRVVETVKLAGRIYEDARNHIWYIPTQHPIFSALAMVAGPVSRQIEAGLLVTDVDGTRRYAEVSPAGEEFLRSSDDDLQATDRWLAELLLDDE
jgi:hypothetical protein